MRFEVPEDRSYRESHEWVAVEDGVARVGLTDFAQDELGDVVFVKCPDVGDHLDAGEQFGTVESIKAVADLYAPVGGEVVAVNDALQERPETVNEDPYGDGWLIALELDEDGGTDHLLSAEEYRNLTQ